MFTVTRYNDAVDITMPFSATRTWQQTALAISDIHFDSQDCDRKMLKRLLDQAVELEAPIIVAGDLYDAMQSRDDPRRCSAALKPEYLVDYVDAIVDEAVEFLRPYAANIALLTTGNHESNIAKRLGTNIVKRTAKALGVLDGGYACWARFKFSESGKLRTTWNTYIYHGSGGASPVTKGIIQANRRAVYLDGADLVITGHTHRFYITTNALHGISPKGHMFVHDQHHVSLGCFVDSFMRQNGWSVEKGFGPADRGGAWLRWRYADDDHRRTRLEITQAT